MNKDLLLQELDRLATKAVDSYLEKNGFVLYSGGIDSSILAFLVSRRAKKGNWKLFTLGSIESSDIRDSTISTETHSPFEPLERIKHEIDEDEIVRAARETQNLVQVESLSHFEDCTAFYAIFEVICDSYGNDRLVFSANGPDELFCGYDRFRRIIDRSGSEATQAEIINALKSAKLLREEVKKIASHFSIRIVEPFFDPEFVDFCVNQIPIELKIAKEDDLLRKRIWRDYGRFLGLPEDLVMRRKKAMQYSMGIHRIILSLVKKGKIIINQPLLPEIK